MTWTEPEILSLPLGESNRFERKGTRLFDFSSSKSIAHLVRTLAKEVSAFANSGGGSIICGVDDQGHIESGGIPRIANGRETTKSWLENIIPTLTDFAVVGFTVEEVVKDASNSSQIAPDRSVLVINIPDSERAPHQAKDDHIYYIRVSGKCLPAPHWLLEDIRNRRRHPDLRVSVSLTSVRVPGSLSPGAHNIQLLLALDIKNCGPSKAANCCIQIKANEPSVRMELASPDRFSVIDAGSENMYLEFKHPVYPGMQFPASVHLGLTALFHQFEPARLGQVLWNMRDSGKELNNLELTFACYSDNAPPRTFVTTGLELKLDEALRAEIKKLHHDYRRYFGFL